MLPSIFLQACFIPMFIVAANGSNSMSIGLEHKTLGAGVLDETSNNQLCYRPISAVGGGKIS